ncbi:MAG: hypothetical protein MZW92_40135 [Comamonadaceae bacterium]|nr:hypothetical protein [Comamonadaceae bacterium]
MWLAARRGRARPGIRADERHGPRCPRRRARIPTRPGSRSRGSAGQQVLACS